MEKINGLNNKNEITGEDEMSKIQDEIKMNEIEKEMEEKRIKEEIKERQKDEIIKASRCEKTVLQKSKERDGLRRLVEDRFRGNMTTCARAARVSTSTVSRVVKGETMMGGRLLRGLIGYFEKNNLDYNNYFSFK